MTKSRMKRSQINIVLSFFLGLSTTISATQIYRSQDSEGHVLFSDKPSPLAKLVQAQQHPYRYRYQLDHVYDGDTIMLRNGEHIRFLGLNAPEIQSRFRNGQPGGQQAKKWLQHKLGKGPVYLEFDQHRRDKYHRLLAYCFTADGEFINQSLLRKGLAMLTIRPPDLRYSKQLQKAQSEAIRQKRGIWHMQTYQAKTLPSHYPGNNWSGWQRLNVKVKAIKSGRKYQYLVINRWLDIEVPDKDLKLFPPLQNYLGQSVQIRGWLSRHNQHYSMRMVYPSAISRL